MTCLATLPPMFRCAAVEAGRVYQMAYACSVRTRAQVPSPASARPIVPAAPTRLGVQLRVPVSAMVCFIYLLERLHLFIAVIHLKLIKLLDSLPLEFKDLSGGVFMWAAFMVLPE